MAIVGMDRPDFRTVNKFRKRHLDALRGMFATLVLGTPKHCAKDDPEQDGGVRKLPLTNGNQTWTPCRRVSFTRDHRPLVPARGLRWTLATAGISPAPSLTALPGTPVAVATAREGVEETRPPGRRRHLPERPDRRGLCTGNPPGVADTDRYFAGDVSGLWHEPGTLVEHFRTDGLVGLCEAAVTGPASPGAEWRCQPTGR